MVKNRQLSLLRTVGSTAWKATTEALQRKLSLETEQKDEETPGALARISQSSEAAFRLARGLDELKGAAMKIGQMLSLEHDLLPPGWQEALATLQSQGTPRPFAEIRHILQESLGSLEAFSEIDEKAVHAASMSQVHKARLRESGKEVAVKVRYPDLKQHVASDLKSMAKLLKIAGIVSSPKEIDRILCKVEEVFQQELNFAHECQMLKTYSQLLQDEQDIVVSEPVELLCREDVLVTEWLPGKSIANWLTESQPEVEERNRLGSQLVRLILLEVFRFHLVQSDPNPANFLVLPDGRLGMLDFGAAIPLSTEFVEPYRKLSVASVVGSRQEVIAAAQQVGYLRESDSVHAEESFAKLMTFVARPFLHASYDWSEEPLARRIKDESLRYARFTKLRPPPEDLIFLNRRILGSELFLEQLCPVVRARKHFEDIVMS